MSLDKNDHARLLSIASVVEDIGNRKDTAGWATLLEDAAELREIASRCARPEARDIRPWSQQDADMLAAAVDDAIRRGALDPRSQIADCRLDYGRPFSPEEVARHLAKRRHGKNASHTVPSPLRQKP